MHTIGTNPLPRPFLRSQVTYRRYLLDQYLGQNQHLMKGIILDVGGEKTNRRGHFTPSPSPVAEWIHLNISAENRPDLIADAHHLPFPPDYFDCVICCEVLEHVINPFQVCQEIERVVRPGGAVILSIPFLFPIHADPYDFWRFTPQALRLTCEMLQGASIHAMGGTLGTLGMLIELSVRRLDGGVLNRIFRRAATMTGRFLSYIELRNAMSSSEMQRFTTGFFCVAYKEAHEHTVEQ